VYGREGKKTSRRQKCGEQLHVCCTGCFLSPRLMSSVANSMKSDELSSEPDEAQPGLIAEDLRGPFAQDGVPQVDATVDDEHAWGLTYEELKSRDERMVKDYREEIDTLLVFVCTLPLP
jgi:hypothetical protein